MVYRSSILVVDCGCNQPAGSNSGGWVGRSIAIQTVNSILDGVYHMATFGREGVARLDKVTGELYLLSSEIDADLTQLGHKVSDRGVVVTLLSAEKVQSMEESIRAVGETVAGIFEVLRTAAELGEAIDNLPFVELPKTDDSKVQTLQQDIQEIREAVERLAADIQAFRDGAATKIGRIAAGVNQVSNQLANVQKNPVGCR